LQQQLGCLSGPHRDPVVEHVALLEDVGELERVAPHALVLLTQAAAAVAGTSRFDAALRLAGSRRVAALVLPAGHGASVGPKSSAIARDAGVAILQITGDADLAQLAILAGRELAGGAEAALLHAHAALREIEAQPVDGGAEALVERAGTAFGVPLRIARTEPRAGPRAAIVIDDHVEGWVTASRQHGDLALGLEIVLHAAAAAAARAITSARHSDELAIHAREEVLSELLAAPLEARAALVKRARALGFAIDGWHAAVRLDFEDLAEPAAGSGGDVAAFENRQHVAREILQAMLVRGGVWHSARAGQARVLLRTYERNPGLGVAASIAKAVDTALADTRTPLSCGIASAHEGAEGLLTAVTEAKAAVTLARASGRVNTAVALDSLGMRRALVEWYAGDTAQEAVTRVLAPLTSLGGARGERLLDTLHAYLDEQGSITRTARRLNLHRNAVSYRISQIFELLDVDPDNPDDLLLLRLACRARELA
jgi:sugar diacid utilization regulator